MELSKNVDEYTAYVAMLEGAGQRLTSVRLSNTRSSELEIRLEPWGQPIDLPIDDHYDIIAYGPIESWRGQESLSL